MKEIKERLKEKVLVYDGAMGTLLQERGLLKPGACPEELNLTHPDEIKNIHRQYIQAGADVIETNSFGGSRLKLREFGLEGKTKELNYAAVKLAKEAARGKAYVAFGFGPLGKMIEPLGELSFEEASEYFKEQIRAALAAQPDLILIETMTDLKEAKAAVIAAKMLCELPIQIQLTYEGGERTVTGTPPEVAAITFSALGVDIIGTNCSVGPQELYLTIEKLARHTDKYLSVLPNAGLPELIEGRTVFRESPEKFREWAKKFYALGVNLMGGCCGTTPEHIKAIATVLKGKRPIKRKTRHSFCLASRTKILEYNENNRPLVIGERINPTARRELAQEISKGKMTLVRREAMEQIADGAQALDVNVGAVNTDETQAIKQAVAACQAVSDSPLVLDSANSQVLEAGLKESCGKVLINSVNGKESSLSSVLPLARKYGAAIMGLTIDEKGIPQTAKDRVRIAAKIRAGALSLNIPKEDIVIDPLTLTISAQPLGVYETLYALREIKEKLGLLTSLGVSNISYGLPERSVINAHFLSLALSYGLDLAILNPKDELVMRVVKRGARAVKTKKAIQAFLKETKDILQGKLLKVETKKKVSIKKGAEAKIEERLWEAILYGDKENITSLIEEALAAGKDPMEINLKILSPALEEVGHRYERREFFLPHIIMSAETMQRAFAGLKKRLGKESRKTGGKIIMATVEGDVHDIGKNIVITVLENYGYEVFDLGHNVAGQEIIKQAVEKRVDIIGLSALMTTTMLQMEKVIQELKKEGLNFKTMVGGAAVTKTFANKIGASAYARDAIEAVSVVKSLLKK